MQEARGPSQAVLAVIVALTVGFWASSFSVAGLKFFFGTVYGLAAGSVFYFLLSREPPVREGSDPAQAEGGHPFRSLALVAALLLLVLFSLSDITTSVILPWQDILPLGWLDFLVTAAFALFIPGYIVVDLLARGQGIKGRAALILSFLVSMLITSLLFYSTDGASPLFFRANFVALQASIVLFYLLASRGSGGTRPSKGSAGVGLMVSLGSIALLSFARIVIENFTLLPFVRGDDWGYLELINSLSKGLLGLGSVNKYYAVGAGDGPFEFVGAAVTRLSGFPSAYFLMLMGLLTAILLPIAFDVAIVQFTKSERIGVLGALLYVVTSDFGWIATMPYTFTPFSTGLTPQALVSVVGTVNPSVLYDLQQTLAPLGEGFKTFFLGVMAILMLLYVLRSDSRPRFRIPMVFFLVLAGLQFHIDEGSFIVLAVMPLYVLLSWRSGRTVVSELLAAEFAVLSSFAINLTYPAASQIPPLAYAAEASFTLLLIPFAAARPRLRFSGLARLKPAGKFIAGGFLFYVYSASALVLVYFGVGVMPTKVDYAVTFLGFSFPPYYYALSLGVVGFVAIVSLLRSSWSQEPLKFFILFVILALLLGRAVSFVNVNLFNTMGREWRIIYVAVPIGTSALAALAMFKASARARTGTWRTAFTLFFIVVLLLGIPGTILSTQYWMEAPATPFGGTYPTQSNQVAINSLYQAVPVDVRVAAPTAGLLRLGVAAGDAVTGAYNYPNIFRETRPETLALLSSDLGYVYDIGDNQTALARYSRSTLLPYLEPPSNVTVPGLYSVPFLGSPTAGATIGYLTPSSYTPDSVLSYATFASTGLPYSIVADNIWGASAVVLPSDFQNSGEGPYLVTPSDLLNYASQGGTVIVFGGVGQLMSDLGVATGPNATATSMSWPGSNYTLRSPVSLSPLEVGSNAQVLANYTDGFGAVSPFVVQVTDGNGRIILVYAEPLTQAVQSGSLDLNSLQSVGGGVGSLLLSAGVADPPGSAQPSRDSISTRWFSMMAGFVSNSFNATGAVSVSEEASGSYSMDGGYVASSLSIGSQPAQNLANATIRGISVSGTANVSVLASAASSCGCFSIPSFLPVVFHNVTVSLSPLNGSSITVELSDGSALQTAGTVTFTSPAATLRLHYASVTVDGQLYFALSSLPPQERDLVTGSTYTGVMRFTTDYNDLASIFLNTFGGSYALTTKSPYPDAPASSWTTLPFSPRVLAEVAIILALVYIGVSRRPARGRAAPVPPPPPTPSPEAR